MPMNMKPTLPKPAAFGLLAELNEFLAFPQKQRETALAAYMTAAAQREAALEVIKSDIEAATSDRAAAEQTAREAEKAAQAMIDEAEAKAKEIVDTATEQAKSVAETLAVNVAKAKTDSETLAARLKKREDAVQTREDACEAREANAFKDREDAVSEREGAVEISETRVKRLESAAEASKAEYDGLIRDINAVRSRARS